MKSIKATINVLVIGIASLFISSCGQSEIAYNDTVVNMYAHYMTQMESAITTAGGEDVSAKKAGIERLNVLTDSCTKVMNSLKPSENAKEFHQAVLNVLGSVKNDFVPIYEKMLSIENPEANVEEYNKLAEEMTDLSEKLDELETKAQNAQAEYATKEGMKIQ